MKHGLKGGDHGDPPITQMGRFSAIPGRLKWPVRKYQKQAICRYLMARGGLEPPTPRFSVACSTS